MNKLQFNILRKTVETNYRLFHLGKEDDILLTLVYFYMVISEVEKTILLNGERRVKSNMA